MEFVKARKTRIAIGLAAALAGLVAIRIAMAPKDVPDPLDTPDPRTLEVARAALPGAALDRASLLALLRTRRALLIGENHFVKEPQEFLADVAGSLEPDPVVLLLELSRASQPHIDAWMKNGSEADFAAIWRNRANLPFQATLRWAYAHRSRILRVVAIDETQTSVALHRLFLTDSRNRTMAEAIAEAYRSHPTARIVAYGGQMHMLMAGRYRFDVPNRVPAGARLAALGVPRSDVWSVMLGGEAAFPLAEVWKTPGAVRMDGPLGELPYEYFVNSKVYGATSARPLFDLFVHLGTPTRIESPAT